MAEHSGFFDAHASTNEKGEVVYDRTYLAEHFAKYFASFIGNGIFAGKSNELMVKQQDTANMSVKVLSGQGWIKGYYYENDSELTLTFDVADGVLNRIDAVVIRWSNSERVIRLAVKKGNSATKPAAPAIQRDSDVYELKLADVYIKAGITGIMQTDITDMRLDSSVCGFVHGVVEQLDAAEFGSQLNDYIANFIKTNDAWFTQFKANSNTAVNNLISTNQIKIDTLLSTGRSDIDAAINAGNARLDKIISDHNAEFNTAMVGYEKIKTDSQTEINRLIAELEDVVNGNDVAQLQTTVANIISRVGTLEADVLKLKSDVSSNISSISAINREINTIKTEITTIKSNVSGLATDVNKLKALFIESGPNPGCYYRIVNSENEWLNPPGEVGVAYRTTERWKGKPVYQRLFFVGALPNKSAMSIHVEAAFNNLVSISGFAVDSDNNLYYPFPIIISGLTPIAVISSAEGDGGDGSDILIQTNDDISTFVGYILVKYTKS